MTIEYPLYIALIPVYISFFILILGLLAYRFIHKIAGLIALLSALFFGCTFGPQLFIDKVIISNKEITQDTGLWFDRNYRGISFDNLQRITISRMWNERDISKIAWRAEYKNGDKKVVFPGDLWNNNQDRIVTYLTEQFEISITIRN